MKSKVCVIPLSRFFTNFLFFNLNGTEGTYEFSPMVASSRIDRGYVCTPVKDYLISAVFHVDFFVELPVCRIRFGLIKVDVKIHTNLRG